MMKATLTPAFAFFLAFNSPVVAQDWNYSTTVYLFTAETETNVGSASATLSFKDALENLDTAFMGVFEGNNGQWGFLVDYMLTDLSFDSSTSGAEFDGVEASVKTQILTGYLSYRLYTKETVSTDLLVGARWFDTDTRLKLLPGTSPGATADGSDSWIDPVIGLRSNFALSGNWSGTLVADYGGANDRETWQVLLTADFAFNENWVARLGYRHIDVSNDSFANGYGFTQSGPVVGVTYNF